MEAGIGVLDDGNLGHVDVEVARGLADDGFAVHLVYRYVELDERGNPIAELDDRARDRAVLIKREPPVAQGVRHVIFIGHRPPQRMGNIARRGIELREVGHVDGRRGKRNLLQRGACAFAARHG